jgi:hypothetical protein
MNLSNFRGKLYRVFAVALLNSGFTGTGRAVYDSNIAGRITNVLTYDGGNFLITLSVMPDGPCSNYFIVTGDIPADARQMLLARALTAHAQGETINIGYDGHTCVNGWYKVHRIG